MKLHWTLDCYDLEAAGLFNTADCCGSCHAWCDEYGTEELVEYPPANAGRIDPHITLITCCGIDSDVTDWHIPLTRTTFAKALLAYRAKRWSWRDNS